MPLKFISVLFNCQTSAQWAYSCYRSAGSKANKTSLNRTFASIVKILNLYIILLCTNLYHFSFQYLSITCNAFIACYKVFLFLTLQAYVSFLFGRWIRLTSGKYRQIRVPSRDSSTRQLLKQLSADQRFNYFSILIEVSR